MAKKGPSMGTLLWVMGICLVLILAGVAYVAVKPAGGQANPGGNGGSGNGGAQDFSGCPTDGDSSLKIDVVNAANQTGSEGFDVTGYLYKKTASGELTYDQSISDTTGPTASTIDCGHTYVFKIISASGASGDQSRVQAIRAGDGIINSDGDLEFTADSSNPTFILGVDQGASLKVRAWDNNQNAFMYKSDGTTTTSYATDGVTFESTTGNTTAVDETVGMDLTFQFLAVESDTNGNDRGMLVLLEMPTATWGTSPAVYANGVALSEIKGSLTPYEARAYSAYEYVYLIPQSMVLKDGAEGINVRVVNTLADGVATASADPEVDMASRGAYLSTDAVTVKDGAVKDDSATTQVYNLFDITVDMT